MRKEIYIWLAATFQCFLKAQRLRATHFVCRDLIHTEWVSGLRASQRRTVRSPR